MERVATMTQLARHMANVKLPLNVVYWLERLIKAIDRRWKQETRKWPEPWIASKGDIEELNGKIILDDGSSYEARFSLWCRWAAGPSDFNKWGGVVYPADDVSWVKLAQQDYVQISLPDRSTARALVTSQSASSSSSRHVLFIHGSGKYPNAVADE